MKKYFKIFPERINGGWRICNGPIGERDLYISLRYFRGRGFRLIIDCNTEFWMKIFGFNYRHWGV